MKVRPKLPEKKVNDQEFDQSLMNTRKFCNSLRQKGHAMVLKLSWGVEEISRIKYVGQPKALQDLLNLQKSSKIS